MKSSHFIEILASTALPALFIIGWAFILQFPWDWMLYTIVVIELCIFLFVFSAELQAAGINGAPGWVLTFSFFLQMIILATITLARIAIWFAQAIFSFF